MPCSPALPRPRTSQTTLPESARQVWALLNLRSLIMQTLSPAELFHLLVISKEVFLTVVKVLYHHIEHGQYCQVITRAVPVSSKSHPEGSRLLRDQYHRLVIYLQAVRIVDFRGCLPLMLDINGFGQILEVFPLATTVIGTCHRLTTSHRSLDRYHQGTVTAILITQTVIDHRNARRVLESPTDVKISGCSTVEVHYDIEILSSSVLDWRLRHWDRMYISNTSGLNRRADYRTFGARPQFDGISFSLLLGRFITSLSIDQPVDLNHITAHLDYRRHLGLKNIPRMRLSASSTRDIPNFISANNYLHDLTLSRGHPFTLDLIHFFELDWTVLMDTHGLIRLRSLTLEVDCHMTERHLPSPKRLINLPWRRLDESLLRLDKLDFIFRPNDITHQQSKDLPPLSLLAKTMLAFGGAGCVYARGDRPSTNRTLLRVMLEGLGKEIELIRNGDPTAAASKPGWCHTSRS